MVLAEATGFAKEIVPSFNAYIYFRIGYWVAKKLARLLYRVRVGLADNEALAEVNPESTVVFVMNHRSNMDYVLVAFLAAERTALSYAVGEWARIWPLETLFKFMGAFFVRRNSGNPLYRLVLERYIRMATKEGVCQAAFLEGGLSRDGLLRPPKMGLLDYMLRSFDVDEDRDIVFIPVGLNYDRTLEDRSLLRMLDKTAKKRSLWFVVKTTLGFAVHNIVLAAFGRWRRFGYACVNFGQPVSAREYCRRQGVHFNRMDRYDRFRKIDELGRHLMSRIEKVIPVLPVSLVSSVMLENADHPLDPLDIKARVRQLMDDLDRQGAPVYYPHGGHEAAIESGLFSLQLRRIILHNDGRYQADPDQKDVLAYYANSLAHWLEPGFLNGFRNEADNADSDQSRGDENRGQNG